MQGNAADADFGLIEQLGSDSGPRSVAHARPTSGRRGLQSPAMALTNWRKRVAVATVLAVVLAGAAITVAALPFTDTGVACGAPIAVAVNGKLAVRVDRGRLVALPRGARREPARLFGISGIPLPVSGYVTVCRTPARGRMLLSFVCLAGAALAVTFVVRGRSPKRHPHAPVSA